MRRTAFILFLMGILCTLASCKERFNSARWKVEEDLRTFPHREAMVEDILASRTLLGLPYSQVIDSLGPPSGVIDNKMYYSIEVDYGTDVDPVYTRDLVVVFNTDSLATDVTTEEWEQ